LGVEATPVPRIVSDSFNDISLENKYMTSHVDVLCGSFIMWLVCPEAMSALLQQGKKPYFHMIKSMPHLFLPMILRLSTRAGEVSKERVAAFYHIL